MKAILMGACLLASPALAQTVPPTWDHKPTSEETQRYYPTAALKLKARGTVVLICAVTKEGKAADCAIHSEAPDGYGFGEAALHVAESATFKPATDNGAPVEDAKVAIPINFAMPKWRLF